MVCRWQVWPAGLVDGQCGRATHIHAAAGTLFPEADAALAVSSRPAVSVHLVLYAIKHSQRVYVLQGGETADYIGAVRAFGIADKLLFEQLTKLDNQDMIM